jgi:hypothetical protein
MLSKYFCQTLLDTPNYNVETAWDYSDPSSKNFNNSTSQRKWLKLYPHESLWSRDILNKFDTVDIKPDAVRLFKWKADQLFRWHTDSGHSAEAPYCVVNWIIEGAGLIEHNENIQLHDHVDQLSFKMKESSVNDEVLSSTSGHGCLLDVYVPHRVNTINCRQPRVSISVVWKTLSNTHLRFEDLRDRFDQIGLLNY